MFEHERSLVEKYQGRPFVLLGVDEDGDRETLREAQKKHQLNWRSWWDEDNTIARQWKVRAWPTLFLLDGKGVVRWRSEGVPDSKVLDGVIEKLVKETESQDVKQVSLSRDR
jgi:peroxiredoxin